MPAYSLDLRTRVVAAYRQPGARQAAVAALFGVSVSFLKKLLRHERQTGSLVATSQREPGALPGCRGTSLARGLCRLAPGCYPGRAWPCLAGARQTARGPNLPLASAERA